MDTFFHLMPPKQFKLQTSSVANDISVFFVLEFESYLCHFLKKTLAYYTERMSPTTAVYCIAQAVNRFPL